MFPTDARRNQYFVAALGKPPAGGQSDPSSIAGILWLSRLSRTEMRNPTLG